MIVMIILLVAADQAVKYWAVLELRPVRTMEFLHIGSLKLIDLTYLENTGAIFGSMKGQRWFLIGFTSLIIIAGIAALFLLRKQPKTLRLGIALFVAGGIGNLIDRVRFGYVVDMFEVKLFRFAIFNVADICVTCAFVLLIVYALFMDGRKKNVGEETAADGA